MRNDWPAAQFRSYLDAMMTAAGIASDAELSRRSGVDASMISNWRGGKQQPSQRSLKRLAPALDVKPVALYLIAGLADEDELDVSGADLSAWPAELHRLHDVYERARELGREAEVLRSVSVLAAGLAADLDQGRPSVRRRSGRAAG